jgi:hypothetical protein
MKRDCEKPHSYALVALRDLSPTTLLMRVDDG